jgi:hypothetical protein
MIAHQSTILQRYVNEKLWKLESSGKQNKHYDQKGLCDFVTLMGNVLKLESSGKQNKHYDQKGLCDFVTLMGNVHFLNIKFYTFMVATVLPSKYCTVQFWKDV